MDDVGELSFRCFDSFIFISFSLVFVHLSEDLLYNANDRGNLSGVGSDGVAGGE